MSSGIVGGGDSSSAPSPYSHPLDASSDTSSNGGGGGAGSGGSASGGVAGANCGSQPPYDYTEQRMVPVTVPKFENKEECRERFVVGDSYLFI